MPIRLNLKSGRFDFQVGATDMSARVLRDNVVHRMKSVHRDAVRSRYDELMPLMRGFVDRVGDWTSGASASNV